MDAFLDYLGLYRSDVAKDGSCLFRVVSEQIFYTQVHHVRLRQCCVEYMERNRTLFEPLVNQDFDEYLEKIKDEKEWVGDVEMKALSLKYKIDFIVYDDINKPPTKIRTDSAVQTITLACTGGNRYDCVYSKSELSALAFCQSIVYEVLYKRVFELGSDVDIAVEKMLHDKAYSKQRRNNLLCHYFRESCRIDDQNPRLEIRKALAQGVPPFPYKVAKTLDPGIYRNVEFDMWNEKRKEDQKNEQFIVPKLEPGVKCKVYVNNDKYIGHVQEIYDHEKVSIYIEELCKRCTVKSSVLEIVPVPAYKALTWQGGKTYKVYSDCLQTGSDSEKNKNKRGCRKNNQDQSPVHGSVQPSIITRSNSMPASAAQRNSLVRSNTLCSSQYTRKKGNSFSTPVSHKQKSHPSHKDSRNGHVIRSPQAYQCVWNGMMPNIPSPPISIPGKVNIDCYQNQPGSPEILNDLKESGWSEDPYKSPSPPCYSPTHHYMAYPPDYPFAPTAPLTIPGAPSSPPAEDMPHSPIQQPMAIYPYPVYAVPGMYLVCRDGSTLPVSIGPTWTGQEAVNGSDVPQGIPSVYFNTPPGNMTPPPMGSWIPASYGSTYPPAVAFTPPLEMNAAYLTPPWSPQFIAPPHVAYHHQMAPPSNVGQPQESAQN
ncbi:hypothetical protein JTE90_006797 [Oedothorax gibbosus]|uniref:OTU domain-containing protein n=1 Tax=Oedothorax gibbosus TaxID=931172 RepID=A0AAV6VNN3_9ARAC|nr:hypothetical protein JTE90_006797 [Oedothorax gibbosus]